MSSSEIQFINTDCISISLPGFPMPTRKICPRCKSTDTARSHRRLYERLIPGLAAFRCDECKHRFLILRGIKSGVTQS